MDVINFLQQSSNVNSFDDFQKQKQEEYTNLLQQYKEQGLGLVLPLGLDILKRGSDIVSKVSKIADTVSDVASNSESVLSNISNVGDRMAQNIRENAFNTDPEAALPETESLGLLDRAQSLFRGASNTVESSASNLLSTAEGAVSNAVDTAVSAAGNVASNVASKVAGVASEAGEAASVGASDVLGSIGELAAAGYGIYDIIKSFEHPTLNIQAMANPSLELGV